MTSSSVFPERGKLLVRSFIWSVGIYVSEASIYREADKRKLSGPLGDVSEKNTENFVDRERQSDE